MRSSIKRKLLAGSIELMTRPRRLFCLLKPSNVLTILIYHRVYDAGKSFIMDKGVISVTPEGFEEQMRFCKDRFSIITFREYDLIIKGNKVCPPRPMIITFDDGYIDNYLVAFPILKRFDIPACFFIAIDNVDTGKMFWWDIVAGFCNIKKEDGLKKLLYESGDSFIGEGLNTDQLIAEALRTFKALPDGKRREFVQRMQSEIIRDMNIERSVMNWDEIREMFSAGMEFGSHTMTHPVLSKVSDHAELDWELSKSKSILENNLGPIHPLVFSYPVGGAASINSLCIDAVKNNGYTFAVTYQNGTNRIDGGNELFLMKRLHIDGLNLTDFKAKMLLPFLW